MSERFLMGLDLGGGGLRCLLVNPETLRVVTAYRSWAARGVPGLPMGLEYDAAHTWSILCEVVREALERAQAAPQAILGIAATSLRHGSALLDADGHELLLVSNCDTRGLAASLQIAGAHGEDIHRRTGHWPNPMQPAARLVQLSREATEIFQRAATHLSLSGWITWRLCGERVCEPSQASDTLLLELERPEWAWDLIERLELPRAIFPELRAAGSPLGQLRAEAAAELGLLATTPVAVGGGDTHCGLLGAGVMAAGQLGVVAGTSVTVLQVSDRPLLDDAGRLWGVHHVLPRRWALESDAGSAGAALEWIARLLYPEVDDPISHLTAEADQAPPGSAGLLSSLGAEVMNARDLTLPIGNLTLNHLTTADHPRPRRHLARSILEGMACALRANAEQIEAISGSTAEVVRMTGGVSRSALLTQIASDVFDRPVEVTAVAEASALGAAICAGAGAGLFRDLEEGAAAIVRVAREHAPHAEHSALYADLYTHWNQLRLSRAASDAQASGFATRALTSVAAAPPAAGTRARPGAIAEGDIRHELCGIVEELFAAQLITATGGNVSARIPEHPDQAWITPSQLFKGALSPEILVRIGMDGRALDPESGSPSIEAPMHTAVFRAKPEAQAVIHCHAPHATILVDTDLPFLPVSTEAAFFQNIGRVPFAIPGSQQLADAVGEALGDGWAVLLQNHGLLVAGRSLRRATNLAEIIERASEVILGCYAVGKQPTVLPEETVEMLAGLGDVMA